jgi:hypothetical protein
LGYLHGWLLGLPWVVERPGLADAPRLRWFGLDCPPLGTRRLWLLTGSVGDFPTDDLGVLVVLPAAAALRIIDAGDGALVGPMGNEDSLISLSLETGDTRLERVLLTAYDACLAPGQ